MNNIESSLKWNIHLKIVCHNLSVYNENKSEKNMINFENNKCIVHVI